MGSLDPLNVWMGACFALITIIACVVVWTYHRRVQRTAHHYQWRANNQRRPPRPR